MPDTTVCLPPIFPDTVKLCEGETFQLTTQCNTLQYNHQWYKNNNVVSNAGNSYLVTAPGYYKVNISNCNNYSRMSDSILVDYTILPMPSPSVIPGTALCQGDTATITIGTGNYSIKWLKGSSEIIGNRNLNTLDVTTSDNYYVVLEKDNCFKASNAVGITVNPISHVQIVPDRALPLCDGDEVRLDAINQGASYE